MPLGDLESIEEAFIEAAFDPSSWVKALERASTATESHGAVLLPVTGRMISAIPFTDSIAGSYEAYFRDGWYLRDERNRGISIMKQRGVADDLDLFSNDEIDRHPYYQEFLAPHRLRWFGGVKVYCGADLWCLSIQRTIDQGPFSESEKNKLAELSKRLSGAAAIASAIGEATAAGALDAFEISGRAAALINRQGKIFRLNKIAEQILSEDVRITKGRMIATDHEATVAFERCIGELLNRSSAALVSPIVFARKGRNPLLAYAARLSSMRGNALADCQLIVIFIDTDARLHLKESVFRTAFRLTEAEARLAAELATGASLETAADRLGVAKETSRSQLKSIFAKTGRNRQSELTALFSNLLSDPRKL